MARNLIFPLCIICIVLSCQVDSKITDGVDLLALETEIKSLTSDSLKRLFIEDIHESSNYRNFLNVDSEGNKMSSMNEIELKEFRRAKKHAATRMEKYLSVYGYPPKHLTETEYLDTTSAHYVIRDSIIAQSWSRVSPDDFIEKYKHLADSSYFRIEASNEMRTRSIGWVVTHVIAETNDLDIMERHIPLFYSAYKRGDLSDRGLSSYLQRVHRRKFGTRVEFDGPFTQEEELMGLYEALDIDIAVLDLESNF